MSKHKVFLLILFCGALALRVLVYYGVMRCGHNAWIYPDSVQYHTTALNIAHGNGIVAADGLPQMYRLPGYPLFLGVIYACSRDSQAAALWIQMIFASLIPVLVFMLAGILFRSPSIAYASSLVCALHSGFLYYASMISTETLCLLLMLLFCILFFRAMTQASRSTFFYAGLVLGSASLVRPVGHYTLMIACCVIMIKHGSWILKRRHIVMMCIGWLLFVAPWLVRNFLLTGALFFHTLPGHHFLQYSAAYVVMERDGIAYAQARPHMLAIWEDHIKRYEQQVGRSVNDYEKCVLAERIAYTTMMQHPWYTFRTAATQIIKTCFALYSAQILLADAAVWPNYTHQTTLWTKIKRFLMPPTENTFLIGLVYWEIVCFTLLLLGLGLCCVRASYDLYARRVLIYSMLFVTMFVVITLAYGCARLRFAIEPLFVINAVAGWQWLLTHACRKKI